MKRFMLVLFGLLIATAALAVPSTMTIQGHLSNNGVSMDGDHPTIFNLYDAASGGTLQWSEQDTIHVTSYLYSTIIGRNVPLPTAIFSQPLWLETTIDGITLNPRIPLTSAAYAQHAQRADTATVALNGAMGSSGIFDSDVEIHSGYALKFYRADNNAWATTRLESHMPQDSLTFNYPLAVPGLGLSQPLSIATGTGNEIQFAGDNVANIYGPNRDFYIDAAPGWSLVLGADGIPHQLTIGHQITTIDGDFRVNGHATLTGSSWNQMTRPGIFGGFVNGEIRGINPADAPDDGFLRLSAGGGTNAGVRSYIDLSGYSTVPDMYQNIVFGTSGAERMRIDANGNITMQGSLNVVGSKCRIVMTAYGQIKMNAVESGHALFMDDEPNARLVNGKCRVNLSPKFMSTVTVNGQNPLAVNVTIYGRHGSDWYVERDATGFTVIDPNGGNNEFSWQAIARQKGYEDVHFETVEQTANR